MVKLVVGHALMASDEQAAMHYTVGIRIAACAFLAVDIHERRLTKYVAGEDRSRLNSICFEIVLEVIS